MDEHDTGHWKKSGGSFGQVTWKSVFSQDEEEQ